MKIAGADIIMCVGGVQAIATMAFGAFCPPSLLDNVDKSQFSTDLETGIQADND